MNTKLIVIGTLIVIIILVIFLCFQKTTENFPVSRNGMLAIKNPFTLNKSTMQAKITKTLNNAKSFPPTRLVENITIPRISLQGININTFPNFYDFIVIGSGYGGSVSACRLAQAGFKVAILERGKWHKKDIHRDLLSSLANIRIIYTNTFPLYLHTMWKYYNISTDNRDALSYWYIDGLDSLGVVANSVGGGSTFNAGVCLKPKENVINNFPHLWKIWFNLFYNRVNKVIQPEQPNNNHYRASEFLSTMEDGDINSNMKIAFDLNACKQHTNDCQNCALVCNYAKKSLDKNYLGLALSAGAKLFPQTEVSYIEQISKNYWKVNLANGDVMTCANVVVSAGTFGSTKILSMSRDNGGVSVSSQLGKQVSGNGDDFYFVENMANKPKYQKINDSDPYISAGYFKPSGVLIENLQYPTPLIDAIVPLFSSQNDGDFILKFGELVFNSTPAYRITLNISLDNSDGEIKWDKNGNLVKWRDATNPYKMDFINANKVIANKLGGKYTPQTLFNKSTFHLLSGCKVGCTGSDGVVNDYGQVFRGNGKDVYENLYVIDGSILPFGVGVNPTMTIMTISELITDQIIKRLKPVPTNTIKYMIPTSFVYEASYLNQYNNHIRPQGECTPYTINKVIENVPKKENFDDSGMCGVYFDGCQCTDMNDDGTCPPCVNSLIDGSIDESTCESLCEDNANYCLAMNQCISPVWSASCS